MTIESINQSINHKITYVGPDQSPIYFCINQFCKFHHLKLQNWIYAYFKTIKKTWELGKSHAEGNDSKVLLKMELLDDPENSKGERWDYLKILKSKRLFEWKDLED